MNESKRPEGGITVYFALIFVVIISLVLVLLETTLVYTGRTYYDIAADMAVKSLMGEYYLPLYDEYGILAVDLGFGEKYPNLEKCESLLKEYAESNLIKEGFAAWRVQRINVEMKTSRITENSGEAFYEEVVENMAYESLSAILENIKELSSLSESTKEAAGLLLKKAEAEQAVSVIDELLLKLMESIDGIEIKAGDKVKIEDQFVKKLAPGGTSQEEAGINNERIFEKLKDKYCDPLVRLEEILSKGKDLISLEQEQKRLMLECNDEQKKPEEVEAELMQAGVAWTAESKLLQADIKELKELIVETFDKVEDALAAIDVLKIKQAFCSIEVEKYKEAVEAAAEFLDADFLKTIMQELEVLKGYAGLDADESAAIVDFVQMEKTLEKNREILETAAELLKDINFIPELSNYEEWCLGIRCLGEELSKYSFEGLKFDYSTLSLTEAENTDPLSFFTSLISEGLSALVFEGEMSERIIGTDALISDSFDAAKVSENTISKGGDNDGAVLLKEMLSTAFFGDFSELLDKPVFCGYLNSNFGKFLNEGGGDRVLAYELEYILVGKSVDSENLQTVISRLIAMRTLLNLVCLFCDAGKSGEAEAFATAAVGFTGVPLLVSVMKSAVLIVWAFEAALVETAGLLKGYSVPLLPDMKNYSIQFAEIFTMVKSRILSKSELYKDNKNVLGFGYEDYLNFFLLLQSRDEQTVRTMDLIQENLRLCYDDEFRFRNCMNAVKAVFNFRADSVFTRLPFVSNDKQAESYVYKTVKEKSY